MTSEHEIAERRRIRQETWERESAMGMVYIVVLVAIFVGSCFMEF